MTAAERALARLDDERRRDARMLKWLRRQVNADLRYWRTYPGGLPPTRYLDLIADCKARLAMLTWAEHWAAVRDPGYDLLASRPDVESAMYGHLDVAMGAMRRLAQGYRQRPGWRDEWDVTG